ncbi:MAG: peroxiredoxin [Chroococcidiopsidaceae cyanobacterium CP_BM_RX_35]|nr:peroxiredoxin [Chroococcidiopsidaceae cyanobacterium CP_BM_RX_35]
MISRRTCLGTLLTCCFAVLTWLIAPEAIAIGGRLPTIGQPAPVFTLPTNTGNGSVSLSDWRGKWVVLYFYPKDFTAGCTLEARRFQQDLQKYLDKNTQVIGVSVDSVDSHAEFCNSEGLKFPLLADTTGAVSKAYGSWMGFISVRHSFIIDPEGLLRKTFVKVNPAIHSTEVLTRINELQAATSSLSSSNEASLSQDSVTLSTSTARKSL